MSETSNSLDNIALQTFSLGEQELVISSKLLKERTELYKKQGKHTIPFIPSVLVMT